MTAKYSGGCLCGKVRYETDADPLVGIHCQCRDCQKRSGAGHASFLAFPRAMMKMTGPLKFHEVKADSGNMSSLGFCTECGSHVTGGSSGYPDMIPVMAGTLDEPGKFTPQLVAFSSRANAWDMLDPSLPKFPKMPQM
jgi:hypothetical protein